MKSHSKTAITLAGGATILALAVGFGAGELSNNTTTPIADPASSVTPAPPADPSAPATNSIVPDPSNGGCIPGLNCGPINPPRPTPAKPQP